MVAYDFQGTGLFYLSWGMYVNVHKVLYYPINGYRVSSDIFSLIHDFGYLCFLSPSFVRGLSIFIDFFKEPSFVCFFFFIFSILSLFSISLISVLIIPFLIFALDTFVTYF